MAAVSCPRPTNGVQGRSVQLRDYQQRAVQDIRAAFRRIQAPLFVAPTGAGKTVLFAYIVLSAASKGNTVYILVHRRFLVEQVSKELQRMGVRHGVVLGGRSTTANPVQVASVQSLGSRLHKLPEPDLLVVDECHHAAAKTWEKVFHQWPRAKRLGVTATPERLDGKGLDHVFGDIVYGPAVRELIDRGYLADYDLYAPPQRVDLSAVHSRGGDYKRGELEEATDQAAITGDAVEHYRAYLNGRPAIAFCVTRQHAEHVAKQFRDRGFRAWPVDGSMDQATIDARVAGLSDGRVQVLTSCDLISEGFDVPATAGAILLRPTQSRQLYFQQVGRALRPKPDGSRAVILDHVGNSNRHGLPDTPVTWSLQGRTTKQKQKDEDEAPSLVTCRKCYRMVETPKAKAVAAACGDGCPLADVQEGKRPPEQRSGELERVTRQPDWAGGIDVALARGAEYERLMEMADSKDKLKQVQQVRGYKQGWLYHVMRERGWIKGKKPKRTREAA